ncbi:hypothetical protein RS030_162434 [Cryptosporidium xiaoi]|uniref:Plus3 domain-containing protein n=1 Tax=Cryptosporidium xiaoi TaxID=659607 RepID=A0AAV9Y106_9CRYT
MNTVNDNEVLNLLRKSRRGKSKGSTKVDQQNELTKNRGRKGRRGAKKTSKESNCDNINGDDNVNDHLTEMNLVESEGSVSEDKSNLNENDSKDADYGEREDGEKSVDDESENILSDDAPEFEREAKLAEEYETRNVDKRKYELLYKNKKSPTSKQDSALLRLRNARKRKTSGRKLSLSDKGSGLFDDDEEEDESKDEYDEYEDEEGDNSDERDECEDDEDEEMNDYSIREKTNKKGKKQGKRSLSKRTSRSRKDLDEYEEGEYTDDYLDEYSGMSDVSEERLNKREKKRVKDDRSDASNLFEENQHIQEKIMKRCERILDSINMKLMKSVHLTRDRIMFMLEHPRFAEYICGSYVKVPITNPTTKMETFLICEIYDSYIDDNNECILILQRGGSKKEWNISSISNNIFTNEDLIEWKAMIREFYSSDPDYIFSLPVTLQEKAKVLNGFQYSDDDIALILEKKQKESNKPNLSGKVLIENRTNLQTQIKQIESQLKNVNLNNEERRTKLRKMDELQKELEYTINEIEKLRVHKEMLHPDKSLKIVSTRYIGGVQGKGTGSSLVIASKESLISPAISSSLHSQNVESTTNKNEEMKVNKSNEDLKNDIDEKTSKNRPSYLLKKLIFDQINSMEFNSYDLFSSRSQISESSNANKKSNMEGGNNGKKDGVGVDNNSAGNIVGNINSSNNNKTSVIINSIGENDNLPISKSSLQDNEHQFGRRECRPSVMWETKRSKIVASNLQEQTNSLEQRTSQQKEQQRQRELMQRQQQRKIKLQQIHHSNNNNTSKLKPYDSNNSILLKKLLSVPGRKEEPLIYNMGINNYNIQNEAVIMNNCFKEFNSSNNNLGKYEERDSYVFPPSYSFDRKDIIETDGIGLKRDNNIEQMSFNEFLNTISCNISN